MASPEKAHPKNAHGSLFVDLTCIDCETCFHLGPGIFREEAAKSIVQSQPQTLDDWAQAKRSIVSCPTNSIGVRGAPDEFRDAPLGLPLLIADGVYYCGYTSRDSYGASAYFIERPEGNLLVDSPRFHPHLVKELESRGGVKYMFLTHQDDVADHAHFAKHFGCERVMHFDDLNAGTYGVEIKVEGQEVFELAPDLLVIPTPGHTKGHAVLLYGEKLLFTGDHLFVDQGQNKLSASRGVCWYSWKKQLESIIKLRNYTFTWVLPGHGGWGKFADGTMAIDDLVRELKES